MAGHVFSTPHPQTDTRGSALYLRDAAAIGSATIRAATFCRVGAARLLRKYRALYDVVARV